MGVIKWVIRLIVALAVIFVGGAFLLPKETAVARTVTMNAAPEVIFPYIANLRANQSWSPWLDRDPDVQLAFNDVPEGVGAAMSWQSEHPQVGSGNMIIIEAQDPRRLVTALDFGEMGTATAYFNLVAAEGGTAVTWGFTSDNGNNPMFRWMGLMMDGWVGPDYEQGLNNLKKLVEGA